MQKKIDDIYFLQKDELTLVHSKKSKKNQLCFAIMLKHYQLEGRHPRATKYIDPILISCIAKQLEVKNYNLAHFEWEGRSTRRYRDEVRHLYKYKLPRKSNIAQMQKWLESSIFTQGAKRQTHLSHAYKYFREQKIEPPETQELIRQVQSAHSRFEEKLFRMINNNLTSKFREQIDKLINIDTDNLEDENDKIDFKHLKKDNAGAKLKNVKFELTKLNWLRSLDLSDLVFGNILHPLLKKYYSRILIERPSHIQRHPTEKRYAYMAMFCHYRKKYLIDNMAEMMLQLIHKLQTRAENLVKKDENLQNLNDTLLANNKVKITDKNNGSIKVSPSSPQEPPHNIQRLYQEIQNKWSTINLIDILKEADLQIGFTKQFHTAASRQNLSSEILQRRLTFTQ